MNFWEVRSETTFFVWIRVRISELGGITRIHGFVRTRSCPRVSLAPKTPFPFPFKRLSRRLVQSSLRCSRLEGKGKGVLGARETRGPGRAPRVSLSPKTPFPFPFKRLPRRLSSKTAMNLIFTYPDIIYKQTSIAGSGYLNLGSFSHKYGNCEIQGEIRKVISLKFVFSLGEEVCWMYKSACSCFAIK